MTVFPLVCNSWRIGTKTLVSSIIVPPAPVSSQHMASTPHRSRPGTYWADLVTTLWLPALVDNSYFPSQTFYPSSTAILSTGTVVKIDNQTEHLGFNLQLHLLCFRDTRQQMQERPTGTASFSPQAHMGHERQLQTRARECVDQLDTEKPRPVVPTNRHVLS